MDERFRPKGLRALCYLFERARFSSHQAKIGSLSGERESDRMADAAARAGHDSHLAGESFAAVLLRLRRRMMQRGHLHLDSSSKPCAPSFCAALRIILNGNPDRPAMSSRLLRPSDMFKTQRSANCSLFPALPPPIAA